MTTVLKIDEAVAYTVLQKVSEKTKKNVTSVESIDIAKDGCKVNFIADGKAQSYNFPINLLTRLF